MQGAPDRTVEQMEADLRALIAHRSEPAPSAAAPRHLRRGLADVDELPLRARRQALPPGLSPWPARALPERRAGGRRDLGDLSRPRSRRRGHRRAAARHRQARGLRHGRDVDRDVRRRPPPRRDRARLLPDPARDRVARRFPDRARKRAASHHPQPSRLARAWQSRSSPARARRRSSTWSTTSAAASAASTGSRASSPPASSGPRTTRGSGRRRTSAASATRPPPRPRADRAGPRARSANGSFAARK